MVSPSAKPTTLLPGEMTKTQPVVDLPAVETSPTQIIVVPPPQPAPQMRIDGIPMPLCWALVAMSAAILILQIWNYVS
jgi:hypothetical protein